MSELPARPSLEHLRKQAKARRHERGVRLAAAQHGVARDYGFPSWPRLVRYVRAGGLTGIERALFLADAGALGALVDAEPGVATAPVDGVSPLAALLQRSAGTAADIRQCVRLLLDAGAGPDGDAFYHACEHSDNALLDLLHHPGFERSVPHKLDFEDAAGLRWFLDRGVDVDAHGCLHHAVARGRGVPILTMLIDAGADVNRPWHRWDVGRRPLALAARCGHLAAYELLLSRGAVADLDDVDRAVLAVARGESVRLPDASPPALGMVSDDYGWVLGQFALLGRTEVVRALLDSGMPVDTRGWSNFTPLDQAAMHGRTETVGLLVERSADLYDCAFDETGPTPLDCAVWGAKDNRAADGDYAGTVELLLSAGAPTSHMPPTGDAAVDALLGG